MMFDLMERLARGADAVAERTYCNPRLHVREICLAGFIIMAALAANAGNTDKSALILIIGVPLYLIAREFARQADGF